MPEAPATTRATILIVEDQEAVRVLVRDVLKAMGHETLEAVDLQQARELMADHSVHLALCDLTLANDESGLDLLHELAPQAPDTVAVMMTGTTDTQTAIDCLRSGAWDYILKPFSVSEFKKVVTRVLQRREKMIQERARVQEEFLMLSRFSSENPNPVFRVSAEGTLLYANEASAPLLREIGAELNKPLPAFMQEYIVGVIHAGGRRNIEVPVGEQVYSFAVTPIKGADYVYLYGHDITTLKDAERELIRLKDLAQEMALHDALTGLPNRTLLEDRLEHAIAYADRSRTQAAVVFVDLDNFKHVNDNHGHKIGDQVLLAVSAHLQKQLRKTDTIARWGGDELILLLSDIHTPEQAKMVCERIRSTLQENMPPALTPFLVTLSMGVALYPTDGKDPHVLLQYADTALYLAKSFGRNQVVMFGETQQVAGYRQQASMRARLAKAISGNQIEPYYQPLIEANTGKLAGVEALARWFDLDNQTWVSPATFIPLAESMGLIGELGEQVMAKAARQVRAWHALGYILTLSVNVSSRQLLRAQFPDEVRNLCASVGLEPKHLILEMTESQALAGLASESRPLHELSKSGFMISIDDFGQGYSALARLHELPVNELKMDMRFVRNLRTQKGSRIVRAIVELARILSLQTVAEGIEEPEEMEIMRALGVHHLQGYLFGRPMPAGDFEQFLAMQAKKTGFKYGSGKPPAPSSVH